ncbi:PadR family transcriptional regulator [Bacillus xiapuensis]|uniref:PadR family transcriptional regulator n=1 Tax=Bacillus xiapuensis TaxID=2014075 RepID=UPI000C249EAA|nr:PadR family transcriptional regulator [Bacillus xiapuensis]
MEEQLKKLKKSQQRELFHELKFTEELRQSIHRAIQTEKDEDILLAILQLLVQEKTGFELLNHLRGRGIKRFDENEGFLYTFLHSLEQKRYISSQWDKEQNKKYSLSSKGRKLLNKAETEANFKVTALEEVLKGWILYE